MERLSTRFRTSNKIRSIIDKYKKGTKLLNKDDEGVTIDKIAARFKKQ